MKKLLIAMAALMACQAQAGLLNTEKDFVKTSVRCVAKENPAMVYYRVLRESDRKSPQDPFIIEMLDYSFWPQLVGENKILFVKKTQDKGDWQQIAFGPSGSSAVTMPITMNDGEVYYCNLKMEKYKDLAPIAIIPAF